MLRPPLRPALAGLAATAVLCGCGAAGAGRAAGGRLRVVAAESFWGSIAGQLGGNRVSATSIVSSPDADPHDYEPTPADARALAGAQLVVVNGAGYDPWASRLLSASSSSRRVVIDAGRAVHVPSGGNPHLWYSPGDVERIAAKITAGYRRLDPAHGAYFDARRRAFDSVGLRDYHALITEIRRRYAGTPVGASESVFAPIAPALGLRLVTPAGFLAAISQGTDPSAGDKSTVDRQIAQHQLKLWIYNSQNATPDVQRITAAARRAGIPVTTITETPRPAGASFQDWQVAQLEALRRALAQATGR